MGTTPRGPRRHETRALLRAHLAAATRYRHVTRNCPVCHRLLRLATEHTPEEPYGQPNGQPNGQPDAQPYGEAPEGSPEPAAEGEAAHEAPAAPAGDREGEPPAGERRERAARPRRISASK
ncbi:hypothetical protein HCC61_27595 [Streptomyces sp. HNM0575]|uniref:DUF6274 family protein n=1 Tax=Streptomyces sp. HNM0575 TaxID=2716338 RepID=UPI00145DB3E2|nr:DUF6274 family protein [Streptomyces sp. HNM0575]NLU76352.1 hypothetical protein [Streptomyces sp. HNM0575]